MSLFGWSLPPGVSLRDIDELALSAESTLMDMLTWSLAAQRGVQRVAWDADIALYAYSIANTHIGWFSFDELAARVAGAREPQWSALEVQ